MSTASDEESQEAAEKLARHDRNERSHSWGSLPKLPVVMTIIYEWPSTSQYRCVDCGLTRRGPYAEPGCYYFWEYGEWPCPPCKKLLAAGG